MTRIPLAGIVMSALVAAPAAASDADLAERLRKLEQDYIELLIRDREKEQQIRELKGIVSQLRQGKRGGAATDDHGHDHGTAGKKPAKAGGKTAKDDHGHGHGHDDHAGDDHSSDVLLEAGGIRVYVPSVGFDVVAYQDDSQTDLEERLEGMKGFGHSHAEEEEGHESLGDGLNLRHAELGLAAGVPGFGHAQILINASTDSVEAEEAFFQSEPLFDTVAFKAGRFRSGFGFFNDRHSQEWEFGQAPLAHFLMIGDHGLSGVGAQARITPPDIPVTLGAEVFQGGGETLFSRSDTVGDVTEPSVYVGWAKATVFADNGTSLRLGAAGGFGKQQEVHTEDGATELVQGDAWFVSPGFELRHDAGSEHGQGDVLVRGEYIYREKDLNVIGANEPADSRQDGYYVEGVVGILPRVDAGARWEQVGLTNEVIEGDETADHDASWRATGLLAYRPNAWSMISLQASQGHYEFANEAVHVFEAMLRFTLQLGPHMH